MNTRIGKIARLPRAIREELNRRLTDGERGKDLVTWLNGLPEVQTIMVEQFGSMAISQPNLSEWKHGGYIEWLRHENTRADVRRMAEQAEDLGKDEGNNDLSENLAFLITAELVARTRTLNDITDPKERWRQFRQIARELSHVRRDDQRYRRNELRRQKWEATFESIEEAPAADAENENPTATEPDAS